MRVRLHLISAPWATAMWPSGSVGALKAYVDQIFGDQVETFCYSAHFQIPFEAETGLWPSFFERVRSYGEYSYLILFYKKFLAEKFGHLNEKEIKAAFRVMQKYEPINRGPMTLDDLERLERATDAYIEEKIIPNLIDDGINVVGFSLNFNQNHSSLYIEKYLKKRVPNKKYLFLYGGYSAAYAEGVQTLKRLGALGYSVIGEGEKKLELILRQLLDRSDMAKGEIEVAAPGVIKMRDYPAQFMVPESIFRMQLPKLEDLPLPNYDEFFQAYRQAEREVPFLKISHRQPILLLEGSRGCFARCDFCGLNSQWDGFRKLSSQKVYDRTIQLVQKYGVRSVQYLDTVCDTWAERFAEMMIGSSEKIGLFMEMRTHHPERFWTKLALAGATEVQIGIETLSPPLLKKMNKGTKVIHNLMALKYLGELGVPHPGNIICSHPKSQISDVVETKRILTQTPHFGNIVFPDFYFKTNGPIFDLLTSKEKASLKLVPRYPLRGKLKEFPGSTLNLLPKRVALSLKTRREWDKLRAWYVKEIRKSKHGKPMMTVKRLKNGRLSILDKRKGKAKRIQLQGDEAAIYDLCHEGLPLERIALKLGWTEARIKTSIRSLIRKKVLLEADGCFLSLAFRPRSELVENLKRMHSFEKK